MSYLALAVLVTAVVTYGLRALPLLVFTGEIQHRWVRSFLYYLPYAVLTAMTIPAVFFATRSGLSAAAGTFVAVVFAFSRRSLITVALAGAATVWLVEAVFFRM